MSDTVRSGRTAPAAVAQLRMPSPYDDLADLVARTAEPLVYAGDCLAVIGVLAGLLRKGIDPTLYWFDAHGDFHTSEMTPSNFLRGSRCDIGVLVEPGV